MWLVNVVALARPLPYRGRHCPHTSNPAAAACAADRHAARRRLLQPSADLERLGVPLADIVSVRGAAVL
jgi:hypothetical protein